MGRSQLSVLVADYFLWILANIELPKHKVKEDMAVECTGVEIAFLRILILVLMLLNTKPTLGDSTGGGIHQDATVVISSTGEVAQLAGELLGQYEYDEEKECYVQSSTDQSNEAYIARYLYMDE